MNKTLRLMFASMLMMLGMTATATVVTDELTWNGLGLNTSNSSYADFSDQSFTSSAVYAGQASSGTGKYIQLRTNNDNAGIITTTSGGKLKAVVITFNSATIDRKISVYAKNEAYTAATDLYSETTQGTKLGDISTNDESRRLDVDGDYTYIGLRSASGAIYIDKIEIEWETDATVQPQAAKPIFTPQGGTYEESVTVTLSHKNANATIMYFINNDKDTPLQYSEPLTLIETTTITAYAIDAECDVQVSEFVEQTYTIVAAPEVKTVTIAEFLAAEVSETDWYQLTGVVTNLTDGDKWGNFDLEDETGSVYLYGVRSEKGGEKGLFQDLATQYGIQNGSKLTLIGNRGIYKERDEVTNAYFVAVDNSGVEPGPEPIVFEGEGTQENPYTVADVQKMTETITAEHMWVKGFIAGSLKNATAFADDAVATNVALAATADETEAANCLPVQLPSGNIREKLNIVDNPTYVGKEVKVCGTIEKYFGVMGVKSVDQFEMDGVVMGVSELKAESAQQQTVYNLAGQRVGKATEGLYIINGKKVVR